MARRDCQNKVDERLNWSFVCEVAEFSSRIMKLYKWTSTLCKLERAVRRDGGSCVGAGRRMSYLTKAYGFFRVSD